MKVGTARLAIAILLLLVEPSTAGDFARATSPRLLEFPVDDGSHPEFSTEWWYLTGHLRTEEDGELFGFQATWFRNSLLPEAVMRDSDLAVGDVILFHGGWTDVSEEKFVSGADVSRAASNWAGAEPGRLHVWLPGRSLEATPEGPWKLKTRFGENRLELTLRPTRPPLLHGREPGLSRKGPDAGEASYYVSRTRLQAQGVLSEAGGDVARPVSGQVWFDHEFFTGQLNELQVGWDWFSVALDDGTDLMLFELRNRDGTTAATSSGTLRGVDESRRHLERQDFEIEVTDWWSSPAASPADPPYPAGWKIRVPGRRLELDVEPLLADQEHRGAEMAGLEYWEGLCRFRGTHDGRPVAGLGYVELVGYRADRPGGL